MTPLRTLLMATSPLVAWLIYVVIIETFCLGVAWGHYCRDRFEDTPVDWQEVRGERSPD